MAPLVSECRGVGRGTKTITSKGRAWRTACRITPGQSKRISLESRNTSSRTMGWERPGPERNRGLSGVIIQSMFRFDEPYCSICFYMFHSGRIGWSSHFFRESEEMIKIALISQDERQTELFQAAFGDHSRQTPKRPFETQEYQLVIQPAAHHEELEGLSIDADVIVARGFLAMALQERDYFIPVVEIPINVSDLTRCLNQVEADVVNPRVAVVGSYRVTSPVDDLAGLFGFPLHAFTLHSRHDDVTACMRAAVSWLQCRCWRKARVGARAKIRAQAVLHRIRPRRDLARDRGSEASRIHQPTREEESLQPEHGRESGV